MKDGAGFKNPSCATSRQLLTPLGTSFVRDIYPECITGGYLQMEGSGINCLLDGLMQVQLAQGCFASAVSRACIMEDMGTRYMAPEIQLGHDDEKGDRISSRTHGIPSAGVTCNGRDICIRSARPTICVCPSLLCTIWPVRRKPSENWVKRERLRLAPIQSL